jgi:hypothetical protein
MKSKAYQNERIDMGVLSNYVQGVKNQQIREWIKILVCQFSNERIKIFNLLRNFTVPTKNLNFISIVPKIKTHEERLA